MQISNNYFWFKSRLTEKQCTDILSAGMSELVKKKSSEVGRMLVDNGSTYACVTERFFEEQTFYGIGLKGHLMPRESSVDLDTPEDLAYLEYLLLKKDKGKNVIE